MLFVHNKEKNKNSKFTYREYFKFISQIDIKFFEITDITKELIDDLIYKLNSLFKGKDIKIIEMKKGSLDIVIALNYLIQEGLNKFNIHDITIDILFQQLTEILNIETYNIKNMIQDNLIICQQDKKFKPDFVNENLLDLTKEES